MEINYEIVPEDITIYSGEAAKAYGNPLFMTQTVIMVSIVILFMVADMLLAVVAVGLNDGSIKVESFHMLPRLIIAFALIGITYVVLRTVSIRASRKAAETAGKNCLFCEHTITLAENGFTEKTEIYNCFYYWEAVEKVMETNNYVTVRLRLGGGYFVPKRAFATDEEVRAFIDTIWSHLPEDSRPQPRSVATNY